jgi:hypothetical protein
MKSLNIKKTGASLLMLAIVAGCSSNTPVSSVKAPVTKVDTVKVSPVKTIDLGAKNGGTVKLKLNFGERPSFGIKQKYPVNTSGLPLVGFYTYVNLFRIPHGMTPPPPKQRFDAPDPVDIHNSAHAGTVFRYWSGAQIDATNDLTFSGLQAGFDYYITARLYSPAAQINNDYLYGDTDGTGYIGSDPLHDESHEFLDATTISNVRTPLLPAEPGYPGMKPADLNYLGLNSTDWIAIYPNPSVGWWGCAQINVPPQGPGFDSFTVAPYGISANHCPGYTGGYYGVEGNVIGDPPSNRGYLFQLWRNVVGVGNLGISGATGKGMANNDSAIGGGTAPGYTGYTGAGCPTGTCEEFIHIDNNGLTTIVHDDNPAAPGTPDSLWDVKVNLMHSLGAVVQNPGNIAVYPGTPDQGPNVVVGH